MDRFSILTNRKRAVVALVHSVIFLVVALRQMVPATSAYGISFSIPVPIGTWILCILFAVVSSILCWLLIICRGRMEKLYFGFCTTSAVSGLIRTAAGDRVFHVGVYVRVFMLLGAVFVGLLIVRQHPAANSKDFTASCSSELNSLDS